MERAMLEYLANALWQLPVLAAGAWALLWLIKPGPQTQYRVWLGVLGLAVVLPAVGISGGEIVPVPGAAFDKVATTRIVERSSAVVVVDETAPMPVVSEPAPAGAAAKGIWRLPFRVERVHLSATAMHWVMGVYAGSVLLGLVRVMRAWRGARRLVETSREVALCSAAETVLEDFGRSFDVKLPAVRECAEVTSPMVVGAGSPVVLLPEGFVGHAEDEVRAALLHELAHVKRRDYLMNGVCQVAVLPVLWHPVAYGVQRRICRTREMACDQMAAREMRSELGYARALLALARGMLGGRLSGRPEYVGLFSNNVLEERVMRLVETKSVLTARTKLVRLVSGATAMATATLMATSFHVVPTMAVENPRCEPMLQMAALRSGDVPMPFAELAAPGQTATARPGVVPPAPVTMTPVAPAALVLTDVTPAAAPEGVRGLQSGPVAVAPVAPVGLVAPAAMATAPAVPAVAPVAPAVFTGVPQAGPVAPGAPGRTDDQKTKGGKNKTYAYRMTGPNGEGMVIVNGEMRQMTPEERERIEKAMAASAETIKKAMAAVNSEEFKKQMDTVRREMEELQSKAYDNSEAFSREMDEARREMAQQSALNSAEMRERMAQVQSMMRDMKMPKMEMFCCKCKDDGVKDKAKEKDKEKAETPQAK